MNQSDNESKKASEAIENDPNTQHKDYPAQPELEAKEKAATKNDLTSEDLPDATNTSTGNTGSGQRQDSN